MPKIKAQNINWLERAWRTSVDFVELPDGPNRPNLLKPDQPVPELPEIPRLTRICLQNLQDEIALHLTYRISVVHKFKFDDVKGYFHVEDKSPDRILRAYAATGVTFDECDDWAIFVQARLARILIDRYVCPEWKRELPLMIAAIGGKSLGQVAHENSTGARQPRRSRLELAKRRAKAANPGCTWKELLPTLQGDEIVVEWDHTAITWIDDDGQHRRTQTSTFRNWK
jgi:hypothetical protein